MHARSCVLEGRAATPEESVRAWLAIPQLVPGEWECRANQVVYKLKELLLDVQHKGEIEITVPDRLDPKTLSPGLLHAEPLWVPKYLKFPFNLVEDQVECDGKSYDVVGVRFAGEDEPVPVPAHEDTAAIPEARPAISPAAPVTKTKDWLQSRYDERVTEDHAPTRAEDKKWGRNQGITRARLWGLRHANSDPRLHQQGPRPKKRN